MQFIAQIILMRRWGGKSARKAAALLLWSVNLKSSMLPLFQLHSRRSEGEIQGAVMDSEFRFWPYALNANALLY